jgi:hypothetical protein
MGEIEIFSLSDLFNLTEQREIFISLSFNINHLKSKLQRLQEQNDQTKLNDFVSFNDCLSKEILFKHYFIPRNIIHYKKSCEISQSFKDIYVNVRD